MGDDKKAICQDCGAVVPLGEKRCEDCQDKYAFCDKCGKECLNEDTTEYAGEIYCRECADRHLGDCDVCECIYNINENGNWGWMCPSCAEEHFECENCGEVVHNDNYAEDGICNACQRRETSSGHIHEYHHCSNYTFHPRGEKLYFGVELETDNYDDRCSAGDLLYTLSKKETLFFMEEDSSLDRGIEIISQPCSLDYHKHYFPWKEIVKVVSEHGGKSHDTHTCGLHIHFSRETFKGQRDKLYQIRLVYLFEKFWRELVQFSRREGPWEHTARKYNIPIYDKPTSEKLRDIKRNFHRYQAVNLINDYTIEIRIFRGSLKVSTILASLELVDFLVRLVKKASNKELQAMTWVEVVEKVKHSKYEHLYPYLKDIGLAEGGQNVLDSSEA